MNNGIQSCVWESGSAGCAGKFGTDLAARWFGMSAADIESAAGRFARGRNAGNLRGWIVWRKCSVGGWSHPLNRVIRPGMIFAQFARTWDEMQNLMTLPTDRFFPACRVDTCYGHNPAAERAAANAAAAVPVYAETMGEIRVLRGPCRGNTVTVLLAADARRYAAAVNEISEETGYEVEVVEIPAGTPRK